MRPAGLLHSEISGSKCVCHSPELIAAYHVLRRLAMPRHPPCALSRLIVLSFSIRKHHLGSNALQFAFAGGPSLARRPPASFLSALRLSKIGKSCDRPETEPLGEVASG